MIERRSIERLRIDDLMFLNAITNHARSELGGYIHAKAKQVIDELGLSVKGLWPDYDFKNDYSFNRTVILAYTHKRVLNAWRQIGKSFDVPEYHD